MKDNMALGLFVFLFILVLFISGDSKAYGYSYITCKSTANGKILCVDSQTGKVFILNPQRT